MGGASPFGAQPLRGLPRSTSGTASSDPPQDTSAFRPQESGGYTGPAQIDDGWWRGVAADVLGRLPRAPGAGEGPTPADIDRLAALFQAVMAHRGGDTEARLRRIFRVEGGTLADLRQAVVMSLLDLVSDSVIAAASGGTQPEGDTAAAASQGEPAADQGTATAPTGPPASQAGKKPETEEMHECYQFKGPDQRDLLLRAARHREALQGEFRAGLPKPAAKKRFDQTVPLDIPRWSMSYWLAANVAQAGRGVDVVDDLHSCPPGTSRRPSGPGVGRRSELEIGPAVHEVLQSRYLNERKNRLIDHLVVAEHDLYPGAAGRGRRPRRLSLYGEARRRKPGVLESLVYALGTPPKALRPDIADLTLATIIEIKPVRSFHLGVLQVWQYIHNFNLAKAFDEETFVGATERGFRISPAASVPSHILTPFQLGPILEGEARDRYGHLIAAPFMITGVPGVLGYTLADPQKPKDGDPLGDLLTATAIAAGILLAVVVGFIALAAIAEAAAVAEAGALVAGEVGLLTEGGATALGEAGATAMGQIASESVVTTVSGSAAVGAAAPQYVSAMAQEIAEVGTAIGEKALTLVGK